MAKFELISDDFDHNALIPKKFTCDGENISPHLRWLNVPEDVQSFAIIVDDIDAMRVSPKNCLLPWHLQMPIPKGPVSKRPFVHWVIYNIPKGQYQLGQDLEKIEDLANGIKQGYNDFCDIGYKGPCPPIGQGEHSYRFRIFALDTKLKLEEPVTKESLVEAIKDHVIDLAEFIAKYKRD